MIKNLWKFRYFVLTSILGELRNRYVRSRLGLLWSIIHPLIQAAVFSLVLSEVLGAKLAGVEDKTAYPIYLLSGIAAWTLFVEIFNRCLTVFIEFASNMKKISFPRICLPLIVLGGAIINHILLLGAICLVLLAFGRLPGVAVFSVFVGMILISLFALSLGLLLGIFNVFSRDVGQAMAAILQFWYWLTPIVYPRSVVPEHLQWLLDLNPLTSLVGIYHDAFIYNKWPDFGNLIESALITAVVMILAAIMFRKASPEIVDVL